MAQKRVVDVTSARAARTKLVQKYSSRADMLEDMQQNATNMKAKNVAGELGVLKDRARTYAKTARRMNGDTSGS